MSQNLMSVCLYYISYSGLDVKSRRYLNHMKKILVVLSIIAGILIVGLAALLIIGPPEPKIQTEEERIEYTNRFKNLNISGFEAKNLKGEKITSDIFKKNKITMVNIWFTECSPCVSEMPDLGKLYKDLPKDSNIIGICADAGEDDDTLKQAQKIMKKSNAEFDVLIPDEVLKSKLMKLVTAYPTTLFIDSNGNIVGDDYSGSHDEKSYREAIVNRLNLLQDKK